VFYECKEKNWDFLSFNCDPACIGDRRIRPVISRTDSAKKPASGRDGNATTARAGRQDGKESGGHATTIKERPEDRTGTNYLNVKITVGKANG